jgi:hypothetical protein
MFQQNSGTYNSLASVQLTPSVRRGRPVELPYNIDEKETASFVINHDEGQADGSTSSR